MTTSTAAPSPPVNEYTLLPDLPVKEMVFIEHLHPNTNRSTITFSGKQIITILRQKALKLAVHPVPGFLSYGRLAVVLAALVN